LAGGVGCLAADGPVGAVGIVGVALLSDCPSSRKATSTKLETPPGVVITGRLVAVAVVGFLVVGFGCVGVGVVVVVLRGVGSLQISLRSLGSDFRTITICRLVVCASAVLKRSKSQPKSTNTEKKKQVTCKKRVKSKIVQLYNAIQFDFV
jgi:hypothetical protein